LLFLNEPIQSSVELGMNACGPKMKRKVPRRGRSREEEGPEKRKVPRRDRISLDDVWNAGNWQ
jgi:hypothetical protein